MRATFFTLFPFHITLPNYQARFNASFTWGRLFKHACSALAARAAC